jgi:hypothetical protein
MDKWYLINITKKQKCYDSTQLFNCLEVIDFFFKLFYWDKQDKIYITNGDQYIHWRDYKKLKDKYETDDNILVQIFGNDYIVYFPIFNEIELDAEYTHIPFTLELVITIEEYLEIHNVLKEKYSFFDFRRI